MRESIVVVGGGAAGAGAAESLRREGFTGRLTLVGEEPGLPYDRPPLSKQVLSGAWPPDRTVLRDRDHYDGLGVTLRPARATGLDAAGHRLRLEDGTALEYDGLVIATGVTPRRLPFGHDLAGVHVLRTVDDATALGGALTDARRLVVIGAGFLGTEVAAVAAQLGLAVTVVDPLPVPMARQLGVRVAERLCALHRERGVTLLTETSVGGFTESDGRVDGVRLADGTLLETDLVLVAIGSTPAVDWLRDSGLALDNGVSCDAYCRAAPDVYAAGDVASWPNARYGRRMRLEHRTNAGEQSAAAARNLLHGDVEPFTPLPYFWSDQFDVKIQAHGLLSEDADVEFVEGDKGPGFVALYRTGGRTVGALAWNAFRQLRPYRKELADQPFPMDGPAPAEEGPAPAADPAPAV
ncbi:FAD-dependent oxidoreductase [Streptomyces sp. NPDC091212]|uniref:NAD(P)/FAD-dependent oxidoreductase n=1 Tax=Streptomyces sp. NPDC091212 TaxID=3155191 RepID=UPI0034356869